MASIGFLPKYPGPQFPRINSPETNKKALYAPLLLNQGQSQDPLVVKHQVLPMPLGEPAKIQNKYAELVEKHSSKTVDKCEQIILSSDKMAIYRNVYKLAITMVGLICASLAVAGVCNPWVLAAIAAGVVLVSIIGLCCLYRKNKISKKDLIQLTVMTLATVGGIFGGGALGNSLLLVSYAVSVVIQGFLFAAPQAKAWGGGGYNKYKLASEIGDARGKRYGAMTAFSGGMSCMEGSTWMFMGSLMITQAIVQAINLIAPGSAIMPEIVDKVLPWVTDVLFFVIFNIGYTAMIVGGVHDLIIQKKFSNKMNQMFQNYTNAQTDLEKRTSLTELLNYLKRRLTGTTAGLDKFALEQTGRNFNDLENEQKKAIQEKYWLKKLNRLKNVAGDSFPLLTIENIDQLLAEIAAGITNNAAAVMKDLLSSSSRKVDFAKAQLFIGVIGLLLGTLCSLAEDLTAGGAMISQNEAISHWSDIMQTLIASVCSMFDNILWAGMNYAFLKCLDDPQGRTGDVETNFANLVPTLLSKQKMISEKHAALLKHVGENKDNIEESNSFDLLKPHVYEFLQVYKEYNEIKEFYSRMQKDLEGKKQKMEDTKKQTIEDFKQNNAHLQETLKELTEKKDLLNKTLNKLAKKNQLQKQEVTDLEKNKGLLERIMEDLEKIKQSQKQTVKKLETNQELLKQTLEAFQISNQTLDNWNKEVSLGIKSLIDAIIQRITEKKGMMQSTPEQQDFWTTMDKELTALKPLQVNQQQQEDHKENEGVA